MHLQEEKWYIVVKRFAQEEKKMKELFLSDKNIGKLDILKELLFVPEGVLIQKLTLHFDVSYSTKIRYMNELGEDLKKLFPNTDLVIKKWENTDIYFIANTQNLDIDFIIDFVRLAYIQESTLYPIILEILGKHYSSAQELATNLAIAPATIYSSIVKINSFLELFDARIKLTNEPDNFSGNEVGIRFANYFLLWSIFRTKKFKELFSHVPTNFLEIETLKNSLAIHGNVTLSVETKLGIIQGISLYRIIFMKKQIALPDSFYQDIELLYDPNLHFEPDIEQQIPADMLLKEKQLICFAIQGLMDDLYTFEHKEAIVKNYQNSPLIIADTLASFLHNFEKTFSLTFTHENYVQTYYALLLTVLYAKYINVDFADFYDIGPAVDRFRTSNANYKAIEQSLSDFVLSQNELFELGIDQKNAKISNQITYLLIWSMYLAKKTMPLSIGIQISANIYLGQAIKQTIADFIPKDGFVFTTNPDCMDILVTDTYEGDYPSIKKYYFENPGNPRTWSELIAFINESRWNRRLEW